VPTTARTVPGDRSEGSCDVQTVDPAVDRPAGRCAAAVAGAAPSGGADLAEDRRGADRALRGLADRPDPGFHPRDRFSRRRGAGATIADSTPRLQHSGAAVLLLSRCQCYILFPTDVEVENSGRAPPFVLPLPSPAAFFLPPSPPRKHTIYHQATPRSNSRHPP